MDPSPETACPGLSTFRTTGWQAANGFGFKSATRSLAELLNADSPFWRYCRLQGRPCEPYLARAELAPLVHSTAWQLPRISYEERPQLWNGATRAAIPRAPNRRLRAASRRFAS